MIRFSDTVLLATTKLRTHRMRTGITVAVAGLLFGLIIAVVFVVQGVFESFDRFSSEGLNSKAILSLTSQNEGPGFNPYDHRSDPAFVTEVEKAYEQMIATKKAAVKKYNVPYDPAVSDPSPVITDTKSKQKTVSETGLSSPAVQLVSNQKIKANYQPFDVEKYLKPYSTAKVIGEYAALSPANVQLAYMKDSKEVMDADKLNNEPSALPMGYAFGSENPSLFVLNEVVTQPFITQPTFDPSKGEIPVILPYSAAEKLLGFKPLERTATQKEKLARLVEVRGRVGQITAAFCYRNNASRQLLATAITQRQEMEQGKADPNYIAPSVQYAVPGADSCGEVAITKDMRTVTEKQQDANRILFEKETDTYIGDPYQKKLIIRGVGITSSSPSGQPASIADIVQGMFGSWLGDNSWTIPEQLLNQLPPNTRPNEIFANTLQNSTDNPLAVWLSKVYLVDFGDRAQARVVLEQTGMLSGMPTGNVYAMPFGSGTLLADEAKAWVGQALFWALIVVGLIAVIILGGVIGRTISDGRRESAIFRAIGAKRSDIMSIYGAYALLLTFRVMIFALLLGGVVALGFELCMWQDQDATLGARIAYASSDTTKEFHLFGVWTWYLPIILGVIVLSGGAASLLPIVRNARRNPINDMREE